jgi:hypothetical protein
MTSKHTEQLNTKWQFNRYSNIKILYHIKMTVKNSHILSLLFLTLAKINAHLVDVRMRFFSLLSAATNRNVPANPVKG